MKRVLLISYSGWPTCCRLPRTLSQAGFEVVICAQELDFLRESEYVRKAFILPEKIEDAKQSASLIVRCCLSLKPDFIIPVDDTSLNQLFVLYRKIKKSKEEKLVQVKRLIENSRGNPDYYPHLLSKKMTTDLAIELGIRTPEQRLCTSVTEAVEFAKETGYPVILKGEFGWAGNFVHICQDETAIIENYDNVKNSKVVIAQRFISGKPALADSSAYQGQLLSFTAFIKLECFPETIGPSAVVKPVMNAEMEEASRKIINHVGYTGIISFDFMTDDQGHAYLLECNPRPTPVSHLGHITGIDIFKALACKMAGEEYQPSPFKMKEIALFPKELMRDRHSPYIETAIHDVPWDEPRLIRRMLKY